MNILPVIDTNIPPEMTALKNWVVWKKEKRGNGQMAKVSYIPNSDRHARSNSPETWTDFKTALESYKSNSGKYAGIGFNLSNSPYVVIDIDHCINDDGIVNEWAEKIINDLNSYTEISPSGTGIHIFLRDDKNEVILEKKRNKRIEIYKEKRYMTMTGHIYNGHKDISVVGSEFYNLCRSELQDKERLKGEIKKTEPLSIDTEIPSIDDNKLISIMSNAKNGDKFKKLFFYGDISEYKKESGEDDQSRADLALMNILCFYTQGNAKRMEFLFNKSALAKRDKWKTREDYRTFTINEAINATTKYYDPAYKSPHEKEQEEKAEELYKEHEKKKQERKNFNKRLPDALRQKEKGSIAIPKAYEFTNLEYPAFYVTKKNDIKIITADTGNVAYLLKRMGFILEYNDITKKTEYKYVPKGITWEMYPNDTVAKLIKDIAHRNSFLVSERDLDRSLNAIAEQNKFNPVCDYLRDAYTTYLALASNDTEPIRELFECILLDPRSNQNKEFCYTLLKKWLISAVVMAFNDNGDKTAQGVLIFKGKQGIGKTRFLYQILPNQEWGADGISIDTSNKDSTIIATSAWIVELGEFGETMKAKQVDKLKSFITQGTDHYRVPYGKSYNIVPRRTVYMGTVNDDDFLKDGTGNRRYWVIAVNGFNFDRIEQIGLERLWGQAMKLYIENQPHYLTDEEIEQLEHHNIYYAEQSDEEILLIDKMNWEIPIKEWEWINLSQISEHLYGIRDSKNHNKALGMALTKLMNNGSQPIKKQRLNKGVKYLVPPLSYPADKQTEYI